MTLSKKAMEYLGVKTGSRKHKEIIDTYNNCIRPLPRGYRVKYSDSWCMVFVSVIEYLTGVQNPIYECSCRIAYNNGVGKKRGVPLKEGYTDDLIFYDWGANGSIDHIGIILEVLPDKYRVIEGNMGGRVGIREVKKGNEYIKGIIRIKPTKQIDNNKDLDDKDLVKIAKDVINGKYGNGSTRKNLLGDKYNEVQKIVNDLINSKK